MKILLTVNAVMHEMEGQGYELLNVREFTQDNFRCLLIQAQSSFEDDTDCGGQFYSFVFNGHSWCDISEAMADGTNNVWHKQTPKAIFWRRSERF